MSRRQERKAPHLNIAESLRWKTTTRITPHLGGHYRGRFDREPALGDGSRHVLQETRTIYRGNLHRRLELAEHRHADRGLALATAAHFNRRQERGWWAEV